MKRRDAVPAIPPFVDQWGRPTNDNPLGQNRPNPALTAAAAAPTVIAELQAPSQPVETRESAGVRSPRPAERLTKARSRMQSRVGRAAAVAVAIATTFVGMTAASAFISAGGSGSGNATTGTIQTLTFPTPSISSAPFLLPTGTPTASLTINVTNPNNFPVKITGVQQNGPVTVSPFGVSHGCTSDTGTFPSLTPGTSGVSVPNQAVTGVTVNPGTDLVVIPNVVQMATTSNTGCQNAGFTVPVSITVVQAP